MSESSMKTSPDRQLKGRFNYISWLREFKRAANREGVWNMLTGEEIVISSEPNPNTYFQSADHSAPRTRTFQQTSAALQIAAESRGSTIATHPVNSVASLLEWQAAHKRWERSQEKVRIALRLLNAWVSPGIAIDLEDHDDPAKAYAFITNRFKVEDRHAREQLFQSISELKLTDCENMANYLSKHLQYRKDLASVGHTFTDGELISNILIGLTPTYRNFKRQYDWIRALATQNRTKS